MALRHFLTEHRGPALATAAGVQVTLALLLILSPASPRRAAAAPARAAAPSAAVSARATPTTSAGPTAGALAASSAPHVVAAAGAARVTSDVPSAADGSPDVAYVASGPNHPPLHQAAVPATATATPTPKPTSTPPATPTATATPTPTATPNPFASDTLTDLSKVPDAESVDWPAWVPEPVATAVPGVKGTGQFIMPVEGWISTPYSAAHLAIDIAGTEGSPVLAADTGTVVFAGIDYGGLGYAVVIDHGDGFLSAYGHSSAIEVKVGQIVRRGDLIAYRGSTGHSTGPHVHFAIHKDGQPVNPYDYLIAGDPPAPIPQVQMPTLVNLTPYQAQAALKARRLTLAWDPPQPSTTVPTGRVATQQQGPNSPVGVDSVIHAALSTGAPTPTATATPTATEVPARGAGAKSVGAETTSAASLATTVSAAAGAPLTPTPRAGPAATATPHATPTAMPTATPTPRVSQTKAASTTASSTTATGKAGR